jgi:oligosaccharide repeat unit polymerase
VAIFIKYENLKFKKLREVVLAYFLLIMTLVLIVPSFYTTNLINFSWNFLLTNLLIGTISFIMIILETRKTPYSLHLIQWIFQYTFFFIAPLVQYLQGTFPWGFLFSENDFLLILTNLTILLWQVCWIIPVKFLKHPPKAEMDSYSLHVSNNKINILFLLSFLVFGYLLYIFGLGGLFTRGSEAVNINNSSLQLFLMYSGRAIPVALLVLLGIRMKQHGKNKILMTMAIILVLITNFPVATPRFWTAAVFLGLIITFFNLKSKNKLVYFIFLGLNFLFPLLATARNASNLNEFFSSIELGRMLSTNLLTADYDAFSMVSYTLKYIEMLGSTHGNQLLTVLFFFVPRSIWVDKSIGSGHLVADSLTFSFSNVSSPLLAEGIINFGILGVILFALLFSTLCLKIDRLYWRTSKPFIKTVYPFWIGFFFFIMRGDLLSSFAFTFGFTFCFIVFRPKLKRKQIT